MALVKTGNPLVDIRGSVGGSVFSRDKSGLHLVSTGRSVHRRSPLQDRRRRAFRTAVNFWNNNTTTAHRDLWTNSAARHPTQNKLGETIVLTAFQWFMRFNIYRAYNYVTLLDTPPE